MVRRGIFVNLSVSIKLKVVHRTQKVKIKKAIRAKKIKKVMEEFASKKLHSSTKEGPIFTNPKQALAIGYSEAKKKKK